LLFNPFDRRVNANPYPHYERLRTLEPVHWSKLGVWFIGRYDDVRSLLKDRRFHVRDIPALLSTRDKLVETRQISPAQPRNLRHLIAAAEGWLAFQEGTNHKRLRGVYAGALSRSYLELLRPVIRDATRTLLQDKWSYGEMDVMKDLARVLPFRIIAHMLGLPVEMFPLIQSWATLLTRFVVSFTSLEDLASLDRASGEFIAYLRDLIAERQRAPNTDLVSTLCIEREKQNQVLTEQELISVCIFIIVAGLEAVEHFLGNSTLALITHPEQYKLLQENPDILPSAVDELLRFDAPLQLVMRKALEDVEVGGKGIRAGDYVYLALGSANRDPERFDEPDELILERQQNHHVAFGNGHHLCVGAQFARIESQEVLRVLAEMMPNLRLATDRLDWGHSLLARGLVSLPVKFSARG
jgi:hypothetical protein